MLETCKGEKCAGRSKNKEEKICNKVEVECQEEEAADEVSDQSECEQQSEDNSNGRASPNQQSSKGIVACCKPGCSKRMPCLACVRSGCRVVISCKESRQKDVNFCKPNNCGKTKLRSRSEVRSKKYDSRQNSDNCNESRPKKKPCVRQTEVKSGCKIPKIKIEKPAQCYETESEDSMCSVVEEVPKSHRRRADPKTNNCSITIKSNVKFNDDCETISEPSWRNEKAGCDDDGMEKMVKNPAKPKVSAGQKISFDTNCESTSQKTKIPLRPQACCCPNCNSKNEPQDDVPDFFERPTVQRPMMTQHSFGSFNFPSESQPCRCGNPNCYNLTSMYQQSYPPRSQSQPRSSF